MAQDIIKCPECGKPYKGQNGLGVHRRNAHGVLSKHTAYKRKNHVQIEGLKACPECGCNLAPYQAVYRMVHR